jgi:hypothetical protein
MRPKLNLKKLIMESKYHSKGKDFEIRPRGIEFRIDEHYKGSLFINILIKKMIIEWYLILFLLCFIFVISEVRIDYNEDESLYICMFILLFFIFIFNELNENIK